MHLIHDSAIVLKRLEFSESSQVLSVFTRGHGQVRMIAKGARRSTKERFSPGVELLEAGQIVFSVRHVGQTALAILTEFKVLRAFFGLRERLERLHAAQYAADITAQLTEVWDPHVTVYDALRETLDSLSQGGPVLSAIVAFQRTLLAETGLLPRWDRCAACGRTLETTAELYFSSFEGGLICRDCEPALVEKRRVTVSRTVLLQPDDDAPADVAGAFDLFDYHLSHVMGRRPAASVALSDHARRTCPSRPPTSA